MNILNTCDLNISRLGKRMSHSKDRGTFEFHAPINNFYNVDDFMLGTNIYIFLINRLTYQKNICFYVAESNIISLDRKYTFST